MKISKRILSVFLVSSFLFSFSVFAEPEAQETTDLDIVQEQTEIQPDAKPGGELSLYNLKQEETESLQEEQAQEYVLEEDSNQEQLDEEEASEGEDLEEVQTDVLSEEALYNEEYIALFGNPANDSNMADMLGNNYSNLAQPTDNSNSLGIHEEELSEKIDENQVLEQETDGNAVLSDEMLSETLPGTNTTSVGDDDIFQVDPVSSPMYFANGNDDSVSLKTGDLMYTKSLFKMPGRNGLDLDVSIRYNSSDAVTTVDEFDYDENSGLVNYRQFAAGWIFNFSNINIADKKTAYGYSKKTVSACQMAVPMNLMTT